MIGVMQALSCTAFHFSPSALREGMLDYMLGHRQAGYDWPSAKTAPADQADS